MTNVVIAIDDVHPEPGWGCQGDESVGYLEELNKEFGCKFTLFIPSNYHRKYPLSKYKDWVEFWKSKDWTELSAHGHYHQCDRTDIGECEFLETDSDQKAEIRLEMCLTEWKKVGHKPLGWRNPGWLAHPKAIKAIGHHFKYAAIHKEHNHNISWSCKTYEGCDGIDETEVIQLYGERYFIFQSHIAGNWNDNVWNKKNYENFRRILSSLQKTYTLNFITFQELL